jgi:hypothetical protein
LFCNVVTLTWSREYSSFKCASSCKNTSYAFLYARVVLKKFRDFSAASCWIIYVSQNMNAHFLFARRNSLTNITLLSNVSFRSWLIIFEREFFQSLTHCSIFALTDKAVFRA